MNPILHKLQVKGYPGSCRYRSDKNAPSRKTTAPQWPAPENKSKKEEMFSVLIPFLGRKHKGALSRQQNQKFLLRRQKPAIEERRRFQLLEPQIFVLRKQTTPLSREPEADLIRYITQEIKTVFRGF